MSDLKQVNLRELTMAQYAAKAYLNFCKTGEMTYREVAEELPVSKTMLSVCKQIDDIDSKILPEIINGNVTELYDPKLGRFVTTAKLNLVLKLLRYNLN